MELINIRSSTTFVRCSPAKFRLGDLVQLDVSYVLFTSENDSKSNSQCNVKAVLRAIYLLDNKVRQVSDSDI